MRYSLSMAILLLSTLIAGCGGGRGDTKLSEPVVDPNVTPDSFLTFFNDFTSQSLPYQNPTTMATETLDLNIDTDTYANAYYKAVDPGDERTTLADWKSASCFAPQPGQVCPALDKDEHVTFRDTRDLGYGRDMYAKSFMDGSVAIYVDNYVVELTPGDATSYGPLNLDAAVVQDRKYHFGTNAIEFSPDPNDPAHKIVKFFTFGPRDANGVQKRLIAGDLDGRGDKHMPMMCVVCHGGTLYPLKLKTDRSETPPYYFDPLSLKSPKLNILQESTFEFSSTPTYTEAEQKDAIAVINAMILGTYQEMGARTDTADDRANWYSTFAEDLVKGAYGGQAPGLNNSDYDGNFVPDGWKPRADRPAGVDVLYKQVIAPHCISCHSLRGTKIAHNKDPVVDSTLPPNQHPNAASFSTYEEFIGYKDLIIDYVYRRGAMPRSLINYSQFWQDPSGAPTLLATYLPGFDVFDSTGKVVKPGKPVAKPGPDMTVASTSVRLDANASLFSTGYTWSIDSHKDLTTGNPAMAMLDDPSSPTPLLTADANSEVVLSLVTSNANGTSDKASLTIRVDSTDPRATPDDPKFVPDIVTLLGASAPGLGCASCHSSTQAAPAPLFDPMDPTKDGPYLGIPVFYDTSSYTTNPKDLYQNVRDRVDPDDPENSLLLRKPTSWQHGGGVVIDRTDPDQNAAYLTILKWIRDGAPCGADTTYCN